MMAEFDIRNVVRNSVLFCCFDQNLIGRDEEKFGLRIDEFFNEPWTGDAVHFHFFACDPFHNDSANRLPPIAIA